METISTWNDYTDQRELSALDLSTPASLTEQNVFAILRQILPKYDMESIADRYIATQKLMGLKVAATKRSTGMSTRLDSDNDQVRLSLETESLAILQIESMSAGNDVEE